MWDITGMLPFHSRHVILHFSTLFLFRQLQIFKPLSLFPNGYSTLQQWKRVSRLLLLPLVSLINSISSSSIGSAFLFFSIIKNHFIIMWTESDGELIAYGVSGQIGTMENKVLLVVSPRRPWEISPSKSSRWATLLNAPPRPPGSQTDWRVVSVFSGYSLDSSTAPGSDTLDLFLVARPTWKLTAHPPDCGGRGTFEGIIVLDGHEKQKWGFRKRAAPREIRGTEAYKKKIKNEEKK